MINNTVRVPAVLHVQFYPEKKLSNSSCNRTD